MHGYTVHHALPTVNEDILIYFVTHCAKKLNLAHGTIKTYLCGIRNMYIQAGYHNPMLATSGQPLFQLSLVLRGIKKSQTQTTNPRMPITTDILLSLFRLLDGTFFSRHIDLLLRVTCSMAFFGFLRCGEFTTPTKTFDPAGHLSLQDLTIVCHGRTPTEALLQLRASKTDPFRYGHTILLHRLDSPLCPVSAITHYLDVHNTASRHLDSPLLLMPDNSALSRTVFLDLLQRGLAALGIDSKFYKGHSFRIGAASCAARSKIPDHLIQHLGR